MILVADSGSSKTDWILSLREDEKLQFRTSGINPFFLTEKEIIRLLQGVPEIQTNNAEVSEIYFFGAGCSSPDRREIISNALSAVFPSAFVNAESDLVGSAYATCGNTKGLTCILGTGSNISFYDGEEVMNGKHGLGYILGDEGSGTYFGKKLITEFLYGLMPDELRKAFTERYELTKEDVIQSLYQKPAPNFYLASFTKFMSEQINHLFIRELLYQGFNEFIRTNIQSYPDYAKYQCHFVGSIAFHFQDILRKACNDNNVAVGKILKQPIDELYKFILLREIKNA
ncbi:MAG TPA: N-acetylglucosamine kinase [Sphingobacteriaceae bacterium]